METPVNIFQKIITTSIRGVRARTQIYIYTHTQINIARIRCKNTMTVFLIYFLPSLLYEENQKNIKTKIIINYFNFLMFLQIYPYRNL